ncbi:hypothetical protein ACWEQL_14815 [Kitasatospora sp. NPDC004240]
MTRTTRIARRTHWTRRTLGVPVLLAAMTAAVVPAGASASAAERAEPAGQVNQGYSIPVGGITDLGALPVVGSLGYDLARLLGQG